jgi:hypothetical protein
MTHKLLLRLVLLLWLLLRAWFLAVWGRIWDIGAHLAFGGGA